MRRVLAALLFLGLATASAGAFSLAEHAAPVAVAPFAVKDRAGASLTRDPAAKLTLVHVWATWCGPCRVEFPALDATQKDLSPRGLSTLALSVDRMGFAAIDLWAPAKGADAVTLAIDPGRTVSNALGVVGLPTTLVLDDQGREIARFIGAVEWRSPEVRAKLDAWLAR